MNGPVVCNALIPAPDPKKQGVCHTCGLAICMKKYLNAKEELLETQIFHHAQK
jgi:hypothetical protein